MAPEPDTRVSIVVGGEEFSDWDSYHVESDMIEPADTFEISAPNIEGELSDKFSRGDSFKLYLDGDPEMIGYIDVVEKSGNSGGGRIALVGRDLFSFPVDCSAEPKTYTKMTILQIAEAMTSGWISSWTTTGGVSLSTLSKVKVEPGDGIIDVLQELAEKEKVIFWMQPDGTAVIGRPDYSASPVHKLRLFPRSSPRARENNVLEGRVSESMREMFTDYTALCSSGNTTANYAADSRRKGTATEPLLSGISRPKIWTAEAETGVQASAIAATAREQRAFDGENLTYLVRGHYGTPAAYGATASRYAQGDLVDVEDEINGVSGVYLLTGRGFKGGNDGRFSELRLRPSGLWLASGPGTGST